jgi:hypothetical protein
MLLDCRLDASNLEREKNLDNFSKPNPELSGRLAREVEKSPLPALKLFFNQAGEWFNFD